MGLIRGITIQLNEPGGTESSIENVLIHPAAVTEDPQAEWNLGVLRPDYTLAIPKGDSHTWEGAKATFFGATWEIVAVSGKTIDELTPLSWNQRAYALREMSDKVILRTVLGRIKGEHNIYKTEYREVEIDATAHPIFMEKIYVANKNDGTITRKILIRQADFASAGVKVGEIWHEPSRVSVDKKEYEIASYENIGNVIMLLNLTTGE